ncbi:hypothetical protein BDN72DRAFT_790450 [Pluteus cervinus]|uniref:Uncharacterized protein n=1 Tax=Pluteus cervinus TaxID=181527 RepID=A0ACD3B9V4_9AGAR|nr:hypothetical protein BDN72DRAFT_790450 [Pluteus cervinus]
MPATLPSHSRDQLPSVPSNTEPIDLHTGRLETVVKRMSEQAARYEVQMRDLEAKLSENLSNYRAIDGLMQEAVTGVKKTSNRADRALNTQVPHINRELETSMQALNDLADVLPTIRDQVRDIQGFYDTGKTKAEHLEMDLTWLNKDFYERWRCIIFDESPVSWRWKAIMRCLFTISFLICTWLFWLLLAGAYKAHRHRLVWGERLMS